jgi:replicative DNA helicase
MSLEAEQHLLACVLIDDKKTAELLEIPEDWFLANAHKLVYRKIAELARNNLGTDLFSVATSLQQAQQLESAGGMEYLSELSEQVPSLAHWNSYKNVLFGSYKRNQVKKLADNLQAQVGTNAKPDEMIQYIQESVIALLTDHHNGGPQSISTYMDQVIEDMQWRMDNQGKMRGSQTGFAELDKAFDGFESGKMYLIAGRPGMGKTAFGLVALGLRLSKDQHVVAFSLEMTGRGLAQRAIVNESKVFSHKFKDGSLSDYEINAVAMASTRIHAHNKFYIDETPNITTAQIRSRLKAQELKHGKLGAIFVDHVGLIRKDPRKDETQGLTQVSHDLAMMAKEFDCPMIVLSQLNRGVEGRNDKRPMLSDLKQSGALEEDARGVMLLYRDDYYNPESAQKGITEVIIAKNSDGETKTLYFSHNLALASYEPIDGYTAPEPEPKKGRL